MGQGGACGWREQHGQGPWGGKSLVPSQNRREARVAEQVGTREMGVNSVGQHHLRARKRSEFLLLSGGARRSLDGF